MTQKIIEVIGTSKESFAKAARNAVAEAAKTVRGIKWAHVDSLDMEWMGRRCCSIARPPKFILMWRSESSLP